MIQKENAERQYVINGARVALRQNDLATAKSKLQEHRTQIAAIENHPQAGVSHQVAAMIALEEGDYETALAELEQTSQLNPYNVYREAMVYEAKGDTEKAKELFRKTAEFNAPEQSQLRVHPSQGGRENERHLALESSSPGRATVRPRLFLSPRFLAQRLPHSPTVAELVDRALTALGANWSADQLAVRD